MKILKIIGGILVAIGGIAFVSEVWGFSLLVYYGKAIGGFIGLAAILLGAMLITIATQQDNFKEAGNNVLKWYIVFVDGFNDVLGIGVGWFTTIMVVVVFVNCGK